MKRILSTILVVVLVVSSSGGAVAQTDVPAGMVGVPDANVSEDVPVDSEPPLRAADLEGSVMASEYAESLEVIVTTPDRASDYLDDGAQLSGSKGLTLVLRDDTHSAGRTVAIDAGAVKDALGYTPESVYGTHEDGEEWSRDVEYQGGMLMFDVPHFSSNSVSFSSEVSLSGTYTDGASVNYGLSDVDSVDNFSVQFTGTETTETDSFTVSRSGSQSSTIAGASTPSSATVDVAWSASDWYMSSNDLSNYGLDCGGVSGACMDGSSLSFSSSTPKDPGNVSIKIYQASTTIDMELRNQSGSVLKSWSNNADGTTYYSADLSATRVNGLELWVKSAGVSHLKKIDIKGENPDSHSVTVDGTTKSFSSSGSKTVSLDGDSSVDTSVSVDGGGSVSTTVSYQETSYSPNPEVVINGEPTGHAGTLAPGETATVSPPESAINTSNTVQVNLDSSSDAPPPSVEMNYSHAAQDKQTVSYDGNKWTESYHVSKTFASDRPSASLTIPFQSEVVEIESLEKRTNGGSWSSVSNDYTLNNTTLTVHLGAVSGGDTVGVRTTGQQVLSINSSITVLEPTAPGTRLNTRVRVDEWHKNSSLSVGRTEDAGRIHYVYNESWEDANEHVVVTAEGTQKLYLPGADSLSEFNVRTVPVRVNARSGEVNISMRTPSTTEPSFYVSSGASPKDDIEYTLLTAADGEQYILLSETNNVVRDSATANSPVTLVDDDSEELLVIEQDSTTASEDGGPSAVGIGPAQIDTDTPLNSVPVILLVGAGILVGLVFIYRRLGWSIRDASGPIPVDPVFGLAAGLIAFVVIDYTSGRALSTALAANIKQIGSGFSQIVPLLGIIGGGLAAYWIYQTFILGNGGGGATSRARTIILRRGKK